MCVETVVTWLVEAKGKRTNPWVPQFFAAKCPGGCPTWFAQGQGDEAVGMGWAAGKGGSTVKLGLHPKSLYISHAVINFYGTEIEIWAGFGPVGNTEKKIGPIMSNFWERFFHVFMSKIFFFKYCSVRTKRLHKIEVKKQFLKNYIWI
jgi:hypothetical protein